MHRKRSHLGEHDVLSSPTVLEYLYRLYRTNRLERQMVEQYLDLVIYGSFPPVLPQAPKKRPPYQEVSVDAPWVHVEVALCLRLLNLNNRRSYARAY